MIACDYFRCVMRPDVKGHLNKVLTPWKLSLLHRDFKNHLADIDRIPRFDGIGCFPCNTDKYEFAVHHYYNIYERLLWTPTAGEWPNIEMMLRHIFGEQYNYGLDYVQLLYLYPTQKLPILLLVSTERNTGKTTFLNLLKEIFGGNMMFTTNETFRSNFNSDRVGKLVIGCDETFINKKEDSEKLKALSTAEKSFVEYKGRDRFEVDNFAKFIFCSNNISSPIYIDMPETRYWVRAVPSIKTINPGYLLAMKKEIPAFLYFLANRQLYVPAPVSRMWFDPETLTTPALEYIKRACRPSAELELAEFLLEMMDEFDRDTLCYTSKDLGEILAYNRKNIRNYHYIICKIWNTPNAKNKKAYDIYAPYVDDATRHRYGRYYTFTRKDLESRVPGAVNSANPSSPVTDTDPTIFTD